MADVGDNVGDKTNNSFMKNYDFDSNLTTNREMQMSHIEPEVGDQSKRKLSLKTKKVMGK